MFYTWKKFDDPPTGWKASKVGGWTADQFTPGGLEITFSEAPAGTKAVLVGIEEGGVTGHLYGRKSGDTNISNTPIASLEVSHKLSNPAGALVVCVVWLSSDYKAQLAISDINQDIYIAYPLAYLL